MRFTMVLAIGICGVMVTVGMAAGEADFVARIPNGTVSSCSTCHTTVPALNNFGTDFDETNPSRTWTVALAGLDSDSDNFANGIELQDAAGTWVLGDPDPGIPALVTNPGDDTSAAVDGSTWGAVKALFEGI